MLITYVSIVTLNTLEALYVSSPYKMSGTFCLID